MKTIPLYNNDGTLSTEARLLLAPKPGAITNGEWRKRIKDFKTQLTEADLKEFIRLKKNEQGLHWRQNNQEKSRKQRRENQARWVKNNPEKVKEVLAKSYAKNPEKSKQRTIRWLANNPEKKAQYRANELKKIKADPEKRIFVNIRKQCNRIVKQVGLGKKPTTTLKWIGCTAEELKAHIESLFLEGMTWDNYGKYGWHIDHIRPISSFKPEEWEQISHYTNLQPLWWYDNLSKGNKH